MECRHQAQNTLDDEFRLDGRSLAADLASRSVAGITCLRRFGLVGCLAFAWWLMLRQFAQAFLFLLLFLFQFLLAFLELVVWFCQCDIPSDGPCCLSAADAYSE